MPPAHWIEDVSTGGRSQFPMNKEKTLKWLALAGKGLGFITGLGAIPFVPPQTGILIFAGASILKDVVNRIGDLADDGKTNDSFKP